MCVILFGTPKTVWHSVSCRLMTPASTLVTEEVTVTELSASWGLLGGFYRDGNSACLAIYEQRQRGLLKPPGIYRPWYASPCRSPLNGIQITMILWYSSLIPSNGTRRIPYRKAHAPLPLAPLSSPLSSPSPSGPRQFLPSPKPLFT